MYSSFSQYYIVQVSSKKPHFLYINNCFFIITIDLFIYKFYKKFCRFTLNCCRLWVAVLGVWCHKDTDQSWCDSR